VIIAQDFTRLSLDDDGIVGCAIRSILRSHDCKLITPQEIHDFTLDTDDDVVDLCVAGRDICETVVTLGRIPLTAGYGQRAREYVTYVVSKVVLMDGDTLAQLMIDFNIGSTTVGTYELKRIDSDYLTDE